MSRLLFRRHLFIKSFSDGYHVAPSGSDSNPGTESLPFLTLNKAKTTMRVGGNKKKTYVRAGTYTETDGAAVLTLTHPTDNGQNWRYYPPSGVNTAIINGAGKNEAIIITAQDCIIDGLKVQDSARAGIHAGAASTTITTTGNIIRNCEITGMTAYQGQITSSLCGAIVFFGKTDNTQVLNNYVHDCVGFGIRCGQTTYDAANPNWLWGFSGTIVKNNAIIGTGTSTGDGGDNGAIDFGDAYGSHGPTNGLFSTNILIDHNYVKNFEGPAGTHSNALYLDQVTSNVTISNNIMVCTHTTSNGAYAISAAGGKNNTYTNNIFDLGDTSELVYHWWPYSQITDATATARGFGTNTVFSRNLILSNASVMPYASARSSGLVNKNFYDVGLVASRPIPNPTFGTGLFKNYYYNANSIASGPFYNTSTTNSAWQDNNAVRATTDPLITGSNYTIAAGSEVRGGSVNFVPISTANLGPPGFVIP